MNHLTNERGEKIYSVGQDGSMARMREKYPDTLPKLIKCIKEFDYDRYKYVPVAGARILEGNLREIIKVNDVSKEDCPMLLTAAKYYAKNQKP